jgi:hypothetical protein
MLLFSFFLVSSCQNERIDLPNATTEAVKTTDAKTPYFNQQVEKNYDAAAEKAIKGRIQIFSDLLKRAENQSLPENSTMNESDVVWNVEALLNSRYGWADKPFSSQIVQKDVVIIPRNADGSVDVAALPAAIEQARLKVAARYEAVSGNKHIIAIDIEPKTIESGNLGLEITSMIGEEAAAPAPMLGPFDSNDRYQIVSNNQKLSFPCANNWRSGGGIIRSAEGAIWDYIADRVEVFPNGHLFFVGAQRHYFRSDEPRLNNPNPTGNPNQESLILRLKYPTCPMPSPYGCITGDDLNFYHDNFVNSIMPANTPLGHIVYFFELYQTSPIASNQCEIVWGGSFSTGNSVGCSYLPCNPSIPWSQCLICEG